MSEALVVESASINSHTKTFQFQGKHQIFSSFYQDLGKIGQHFLVWKQGHGSVKRQYTIANCIAPEAYEAYLGLIQDHDSRSVASIQQVDTDTKVEDIAVERPTNKLSLTIKYYHSTEGGLS